MRSRLDSRYVPRAEHRHDIRDSLWEVRALAKELTALRRDVERLAARVDGLAPAAVPPAVSPERAARWDEAHRLAGETAAALDRVLQNEVLLWQAVDRVEEALTRSARSPSSAPEGAR